MGSASRVLFGSRGLVDFEILADSEIIIYCKFVRPVEFTFRSLSIDLKRVINAQRGSEEGKEGNEP